MKNRIKVLLIGVLILCIIPTFAFAANIPDATSNFYVNDFANVLSDKQESEMMKKAVKLAEGEKGAQVVVTTIETIEGQDLEEYANDMYNQYKIGKDDVGTLILLVTKDRKIRMENGYSMETYINAGKAGRLIDEYAIPYLADNKFDEGLISLQDAVIKEVSTQIAKEEENSKIVTDTKKNQEEENNFFGGIFMALGIVIVSIIIIAIQAYKLSEIKKEMAKEKNKAKKENENYKVGINTIKADFKKEKEKNKKKENEIVILQSEYDNLSMRFEKAKKIHPNIDKEIDDLIEKERLDEDKNIAREIDLSVNEVIGLEPSKDMASTFYELVEEFENLTERQKSLVTADIETLKRKSMISTELKRQFEREEKEKKDKAIAKKIETEILAIIGAISFVKASDYNRLKKANNLLRGLTREQEQYVDKSVTDKLNDLYLKANRLVQMQQMEERRRQEEARRRQIEEEARRRRNDNDDFFGGGGFGGFGGFGGSSGGGGSSRGF